MKSNTFVPFKPSGSKPTTTAPSAPGVQNTFAAPRQDPGLGKSVRNVDQKPFHQQPTGLNQSAAGFQPMQKFNNPQVINQIT